MYVIRTMAKCRRWSEQGDVKKTLCRDGVFREIGCDSYFFRKWKTQAGAQRNAAKFFRTTWVECI